MMFMTTSMWKVCCNPPSKPASHSTLVMVELSFLLSLKSGVSVQDGDVVFMFVSVQEGGAGWWWWWWWWYSKVIFVPEAHQGLVCNVTMDRGFRNNWRKTLSFFYMKQSRKTTEKLRYFSFNVINCKDPKNVFILIWNISLKTFLLQ